MGHSYNVVEAKLTYGSFVYHQILVEAIIWFLVTLFILIDKPYITFPDIRIQSSIMEKFYQHNFNSLSTWSLFSSSFLSLSIHMSFLVYPSLTSSLLISPLALSRHPSIPHQSHLSSNRWLLVMWIKEWTTSLSTQRDDVFFAIDFESDRLTPLRDPRIRQARQAYICGQAFGE